MIRHNVSFLGLQFSVHSSQGYRFESQERLPSQNTRNDFHSAGTTLPLLQPLPVLSQLFFHNCWPVHGRRSLSCYCRGEPSSIPKTFSFSFTWADGSSSILTLCSSLDLNVTLYQAGWPLNNVLTKLCVCVFSLSKSENGEN